MESIGFAKPRERITGNGSRQSLSGECRVCPRRRVLQRLVKRTSGQSDITETTRRRSHMKTR